MKLTHKEEWLLARYKMDCVSLQGVWPTFVRPRAGRGRALAAARLYARLIEEEAKRSGRRREATPAEVRRSLLDAVEVRIMREDADDEAVLLLATA